MGLALAILMGAVDEGAITLPPPTPRCRELLRGYELATKRRQRLTALIERNQRIQKIAPRERLSVVDKLARNLVMLQRERELAQETWQHQRETVIRRGCIITSL